MTETDNLVDSYQQKCAGIAASADPKELESLALDGLSPSLVLKPRSDAEVSAVMSWAHEQDVSVVPRGSGTKMALGNPMVEPQDFIVLSLANLNHIPEYDADNLTVTVDAGVKMSDLLARVTEKRQFLPLDPPALESATVGGVLAANSSGPRRLLYGSARDMVLGMKIVTPDGTLTKCGGKTVKNVAGYDMSKLFIGSLGTLGVIVEATFRLVPMPTTSQTVILGFDALDGAAGAVAKLLASFLLPSAIELLDSAAAGRLFPKAGVALTGTYFLAVLFEGFQDAVNRQVGDLRKGDGAASMELPKTAEETFWRQIRDGAPADGDSIRCKISVPISKVGEMVSSAASLSAMTISHAGSGIVHAVLTSECRRPARVVSELRRQAEGVGGSLTIEAAPPDVRKQVGVWGKAGSAEGVMRAIRESFDAKGIMNPGRFIV